MATYGIGMDSKTRQYYVVIDGVIVAHYLFLRSALQHVDAHRERAIAFILDCSPRACGAIFEEGEMAVETVDRFLQERDEGDRWRVEGVLRILHPPRRSVAEDGPACHGRRHRREDGLDRAPGIAGELERGPHRGGQLRGPGSGDMPLTAC